MFASMIFHRTPFFRGKDNDDQLVQVGLNYHRYLTLEIAKIMGSDALDHYLNKYGIDLEPSLRTMVGYHLKKPWSFYVHAQVYPYCLGC
jgi:casein kinase II subunit alpha